MSKISITIFNGQGDSKVPFSKYESGKFVFVTKEFSTLQEAFALMRGNFTLSQALEIKKPTMIHRRTEELKKYSKFKLNNIILDLDKIKSKNDLISIINWFKTSNLSVILGKSRSYNDKDIFNLKGILKVNITNNKNIIEGILDYLDLHIGNFCKIDKSILSLSSFQAAPKKSVLWVNEYGRILNNNDIEVKETKEVFNNLDVSFDNIIIDKCLEIFTSMGFYSLDSTVEENGCVKFANRAEIKSVGSYFWFPGSPLIMHHYDKSRSISCFSILKDTPEGKEWLKLKTKEEQKKLLTNNTVNPNIKEHIIVNERYLDFTKKNKINLLESFLDEDKSVFKLSSAMGSAKSSAIEKCIDLAHYRNKKVIIVSSRVSVAEDYGNKYNLMSYKNSESLNFKGSLVVQYDSLWKYDLRNYDVAILDEFQSLLLHHRSNLTENSNINAVKFMILLNTKNVLIADAFMTGYEDKFFKNRSMYYLSNSYRDNVKLYEYKHKTTFISELFNEAELLKEDEHLSVSFTSINVMKVVENELNKRGIKTISLSSETSEYIKDLIYDKFKKKTHDSYKVILFTPTLTVGVSILNNIKHHFHYDSGMATDVISSLQMIKRARTAKNIHFYLEERQFYYNTNIETLNNEAFRDINKFYTNKNKTLLVDVDYETGELKLTPLAKYINRIEVFSNILKNNQANAFRVLLDYQFKNKCEKIDFEDNSFNLNSKLKELRETLKENNLKLLEDYSDITFTEEQINEIKHKSTGLHDNEKAMLLIDKISSVFKKGLNDEVLKEVCKKEIETNFNYVNKIKNLSIVLKTLNDRDYGKYIISKILSEISGLQNKDYTTFLKSILVLDESFKLKYSYSKHDLKNQDKNFEKFLKKLGFRWTKGKLRIDKELIKLSKFI